MKSLLLAVVVLSSSVLSAQTKSRVNLMSLGWGTLLSVDDVNTDGNEATEEYLVSRAYEVFNREFRVVALRDGRICAGEWFVVVTLSLDPSSPGWKIQKRGGVDKLTRMIGGDEERIDLHTPSCD